MYLYVYFPQKNHVHFAALFYVFIHFFHFFFCTCILTKQFKGFSHCHVIWQNNRCCESALFLYSICIIWTCFANFFHIFLSIEWDISPGHC